MFAVCPHVRREAIKPRDRRLPWRGHGLSDLASARGPQNVLDPLTQPPHPIPPIGRQPIGEPSRDLVGPNVKESAGRGCRVGPVRPELLDRHSRRLIVEPPDLEDRERGINARPVDLGRRDVDFDRQVGVGIVGDVVGIAGDRRFAGRQFVGRSNSTGRLPSPARARPVSTLSNPAPGNRFRGRTRPRE